MSYVLSDAATLAEGAMLPWLYGFWNEDHNVPSAPVRVWGSEDRFERDCRNAAQRSIERLDRYGGRAMRWMIIEEWDRWDFHPDIWSC